MARRGELSEGSSERSGTVSDRQFIFLDIDGVLNGHEQHDNGCCGMRADCVERFNRILKEFTGVQIVISSAWRYLVTCNSMTPSGFESLLLTHGLNVHGRIEGFCRHDYSRDEPRINVILDWLKTNAPQCESWLAIDDLFLSDDPRCIQTDEKAGLTDDDVRRVQIGLEKGLLPIIGSVS